MRVFYWVVVWPITAVIILVASGLERLGWFIRQLAAPTKADLAKDLQTYKKRKLLSMVQVIEFQNRLNTLTKDVLTTELIQIQDEMRAAAYPNRPRA